MILRLPDTLFGGIAATWRNDSPTPIQGEVAKVCNIEVLQKRYFRRGDSNADGKVNIADGVSTLGLLFAGNQALTCLDAADTDDSGQVDIADSIGTFNFLFFHGALPLRRRTDHHRPLPRLRPRHVAGRNHARLREPAGLPVASSVSLRESSGLAPQWVRPVFFDTGLCSLLFNDPGV